MSDMIRTSELFDLRYTIMADYLSGYEYPWEALSGIESAIIAAGAALDKSAYRRTAEDIWIAYSAVIDASASINGPCIIGEHSHLRPGAYLRGSVVIGSCCVIGNSCELKNCIIFDRAEIPHFNYVGDSILGFRSHMGAGAITSNIKSDRTNVTVHGDKDYPTGLRKCGAMLGDMAEIGCGCVLNPGTVVGRRSRIYPLVCVRGVIPPDSINKGAHGIFPILDL